jgi:hypothetical protein
MSDSTAIRGTVFSGSRSSYCVQSSGTATNDVQEVIIMSDISNQCQLASDKSLRSVWMTAQEADTTIDNIQRLYVHWAWGGCS